ncbi:MAG: hypothetical protein JNK65_03605 [Deltaproteobacteria bacterium]|nr:hypothetical protein [Deltaproteobacteria bacterium]
MSELIVLGHQFIRHELSEISNHPYYQIPLNQHEKILNELNLRLIEAKNLTSDVIPFFPAFKEKMIPFILSDQTPLHWKKMMLSALVVFYFRYLAFQKGEAGYYFLKIKKTV